MPRLHRELIAYRSNEIDLEGWKTITEPLDSWQTKVRSRHQVPDPGAREMEDIEREIKDASFVLAIEPEDDDVDFVPYTPETLKRAADFLRRLAIHAHSCNFVGIGVPQIGPGPRGSIDLMWMDDHKRLLVNFPSDKSARASFYGKKANGELSARFEQTDSKPELIYWLTNF